MTWWLFLVDIDECSDGTSGCEQTCMNTPGSYVCGCNVGYSLLPNGKACTGNELPHMGRCISDNITLTGFGSHNIQYGG